MVMVDIMVEVEIMICILLNDVSKCLIVVAGNVSHVSLLSFPSSFCLCYYDCDAAVTNVGI